MFSARGGFQLSESGIIVTGGSVAFDGAYTVRTFTGNATMTISGGTLTGVNYLLIAGGGGKATSGSYRGGGGAGGLLQGTNINLNPGSYPIVIGSAGENTSNGGNSTFNNLTVYGGGRGALGTTYSANSGGSGGGGSTLNSGGKGVYPGSSYISAPRQGYNGGSGDLFGQYGPGGGGGAGDSGTFGGTDSRGGSGGDGIASSITGTNVYYAGGGAGGDSGGSNGLGSTNYGGGAGQGTLAQPGVLIIRYLTAGTA